MKPFFLTGMGVLFSAVSWAGQVIDLPPEFPFSGSQGVILAALAIMVTLTINFLLPVKTGK